LATEIEKLVVSLEASITKYEKAMARAAGIGEQRAKQIETRFTSLEKKLAGLGGDILGGFTKGALSAVGAVLSFDAVINGVKQSLAQFGGIADQAAAAGMDAEFFQGLAYQAKLSGVEIDGVASALATFNKNSGQLEQGRGKLLTTLREISPELAKQVQLAESQEQRFLLVADAIAKSKSAAEAAVIASAAFGDQGTKLVAAFKGGAAEVERMLQKAKEAGLIVDRDLVANADELGDKLDTASQIIALKLKSGLASLAPLMVDVVGGAAEFAKWLGTAVDAIGKAERVKAAVMSQVALDGQKEDLQRALQQEQEDRTFQGSKEQLDLYGANFVSTQNGIGAGATAQQLKALFGADLKTVPPTPSVDPYAGMRGRGQPLVAKPFYGPGSVPAADAGQFGRGGAGRINPVQPFYETATSVKAVAAASKEAGDALVKTTANLDDFGQKALDVQGIAQGFAMSFFDGIRSGKSAVDALIGSLDDLAGQLASTFLNNGISQLFGGLFGNGGIGGLKSLPGMGGLTGSVSYRAAGGPVQAGRAYVVGEKRPELFVPSQSGMILPKLPGAGGGGQKVVNNVYNYGTEKVQQRQNSTGGIDVIIGAVEQRIKGNMAQGKYRQFGVDPGTVRR